MNAWSAWNDTAASQQRHAAARKSVHTTPRGTGGIGPDEFERANQAWSDCFRG